MDNKNSAWEECLKKISELPPKWQSAFAWLINNFELAVKSCEASNLTEIEIKRLMEIARETDDTILEILLILNKILKYDKNRMI